MSRITLPEKAPPGAGDLMEMASRADLVAKRTENLRDQLGEKISAIRTEVGDRVAGLRDLPADERRRLVDAEVSTRVAEARRATLDQIDEALGEVGALRDATDAARPFFDNPLKVLDRATLGSAERARFQTVLADAGPAALHNAAVRALQQNDANLAAAVVARLDTMRSGDRPFTAGDLAKRIEMDELTKAREGLAILDGRLADALLAAGEVRDPRTGPTARLKRAVRRAASG